MRRRIDPRYCQSFIDANALDLVGGPEDGAVVRILELTTDGRIAVSVPHSVKSEIEHLNTPSDVKKRALVLIYSLSVPLTPDELEMHRRVQGILQGNAKRGAHDRDAYHIVESAKYGKYFITNDKRVLSKANEIDNLLQLAIVTPTQFLEAYEECISASFD